MLIILIILTNLVLTFCQDWKCDDTYILVSNSQNSVQNYTFNDTCPIPMSFGIYCEYFNRSLINIFSSVDVNLNITTNCSGLRIVAPHISFVGLNTNEKKASYIENKFIIFEAFQTFSFSQNLQIEVNSYLLAFYLNKSAQNNQIQNANIIANKILFALNDSITFLQCNFTLYSSTCSNDVNIIPGLINIFNIHFEDVEQFIVEIVESGQNYKPLNFTLFFEASNYTFFISNTQNITLNQTSIISSQIGILSKINVTLQNSSLNTSYSGCFMNEGNARGPEFINYNQMCFGNGGSNSGYGGIGLNTTTSKLDDCMFLTNSTRFMFDLYPYGYLLTNLYQGSGGSSNNLFDIIKNNRGVSIDNGIGGGSIFVYANNSIIIINNSSLLADGANGFVDNKTNYSIGGGAGGSVKLYSSNIFGDNTSLISMQGGNSDSNSLVGEGGGGVLQYKCMKNPFQSKLNLTQYCSSNQFLGQINIGSGRRDQSVDISLRGQSGNLIEPLCPPGYNFANFSCTKCWNNTTMRYYSLWWSSQCIPCPYTFGKFGNASTFCNYNPGCGSTDCCIETFNILENTGIQLVIFLFLIAIGYILRRQYKKRDSTLEKNFDFENATKEIIKEQIIVDSLQEKEQFVLGDLMYHVHRIPVIGNNTFLNPWYLNLEPPIEIEMAIIKEEYEKFAKNFNKFASWSKSKYFLLNLLAIIYYPLYWWWQTKIKKDKYKILMDYLNKNEINKFWKQSSESSYSKFKMTKSADYTLLYIDIFNYKNCDLKYIYLTCPFIIYLSGEGNYLRPFYLCESDQFLVSLFFAVNQTENQIQNRQNILLNLVSQDQREENSKEIRRFLKKFNKIAMTLDFGSLAHSFISNFKRLYDLLEKWNNLFFINHNVKLQLLVAQFPFDAQHQSSIITLIEMKDEQKFKDFMTEIHKNLIFQKLQDIKFGVFIFNTEQDPTNIDQQYQNNKFSFSEYEDFKINNFEPEYEEENGFDVDLLKEQFLSKSIDKEKDIQQVGHVKHQFNQITQKQMKRPNSLSKTYHILIRIFDYIRFQAFSHKRTFLDKYTLIIMICILILLDNFLLQSILSLIIVKQGEIYEDEGQQDKKLLLNLQIILFPYPFTIILSNLFESIWIPSQSYGILKLYLIFNAMAVLQYIVSLLILLANIGKQRSSSSTSPPFCIKDSLIILSLIIKIALNQLSQRLISMSTKLNQLSNEKSSSNFLDK